MNPILKLVPKTFSPEPPASLSSSSPLFELDGVTFTIPERMLLMTSTDRI